MLEVEAMPVPDYQTLMLPLLEIARDGKEHSLREAIELIAVKFNLAEAERKQLLPSGHQAVLDNRVGWARTYLKKAGLLESPKRGLFAITDRGRKVLAEKPSSINVAFLDKFPGFKEFKTSHQESTIEDPTPRLLDTETPEESLEAAYQKLNVTLASELLQTIKSCSSSFFERLVVDVLVAMGYGGSRADAGKAIGKSGDEGIDGIIKEDRLGLDIIYIQAKRWEGPVGRPEVQKFAGALQGHRARKGVLITTSGYTKEAWDFVSRIETKIVLIDGATLTRLMIDHNVGVAAIAAYQVKRVDTDYFQEA